MAERSTAKEQQPDPAVHYDRNDPKREAGAGRLTNNQNATPTNRDDKIAQAVTNAQPGNHQVNGEEEASSEKDSTGNTDTGSLGWEKKKK